MNWGELLQGIGTILIGIVALATFIQSRATHKLVNGVSHDLTDAQQGKARAEGYIEGQSTERDHP